jgi:hypothetical protein
MAPIVCAPRPGKADRATRGTTRQLRELGAYGFQAADIKRVAIVLDGAGQGRMRASFVIGEVKRHNFVNMVLRSVLTFRRAGVLLGGRNTREFNGFSRAFCPSDYPSFRQQARP